MICLLLDIRGQAKPHSLLVWSYKYQQIVKLPYLYRNGRQLIRNETPEAKRWAAVSVPRWLVNRECLHTLPNLPPSMPEFCREHCTDMRTPQMIRDDGERALAEFVVDRENRYRRTPGQSWGFTKNDYASARAFE
jgi:hypothetical protein